MKKTRKFSDSRKSCSNSKSPILLNFRTCGKNIDLPLDSSLIVSRFVFTVIFSVRTVFSEISPLNEVRGEFLARHVPHVKYSLFEAQNTAIQLGALFRALGQRKYFEAS